MEYMLIAHVLLLQPETPLTVDVGVLGGGGGAAWQECGQGEGLFQGMHGCTIQFISSL